MAELYCPKCDEVKAKMGDEFAIICKAGYCAQCQTQMVIR